MIEHQSLYAVWVAANKIFLTDHYNRAKAKAAIKAYLAFSAREFASR
jgi:hypothetical protein